MLRVKLGFVAVALSVSGCGPSHEQSAIEAFERFQSALFARDEDAVRRTLTRESRQVVEHLPWERLSNQEPLAPIGCEESNGRFRVTVRDPNRDDAEAIWVVVREDSHWRVDLIESTRFNHREVALPGPAMTLRPQALTDVQVREAAARLQGSHDD
ncbi:MAG: hypothetical protein KDB80_16765 [Planctomycetes bacterium]|nr:hypothetical protein [Planctomycetota bacterium]